MFLHPQRYRVAWKFGRSHGKQQLQMHIRTFHRSTEIKAVGRKLVNYSLIDTNRAIVFLYVISDCSNWWQWHQSRTRIVPALSCGICQNQNKKTKRRIENTCQKRKEVYVCLCWRMSRKLISSDSSTTCGSGFSRFEEELLIISFSTTTTVTRSYFGTIAHIHVHRAKYLGFWKQTIEEFVGKQKETIFKKSLTRPLAYTRSKWASFF